MQAENITSQIDYPHPELAQHFREQDSPKCDKNKKEKQYKQVKYNDPHYKFDSQTIQHLLFGKVTPQQVQDTNTYIHTPGNKKKIQTRLQQFLKNQKNLTDTAKYLHDILYDLTREEAGKRVADFFLVSIMDELKGKRHVIRGVLDKGEGQKLLGCLPLGLVCGVIELYELTLSRKQTIDLIDQLAYSPQITQIPTLLQTQSHSYTHQLIPTILQALHQKSYKLIRQLPNIHKLLKTEPRLIQERNSLLVGAAYYHYKAQGWESLEEIFGGVPEVIAKIVGGSKGIWNTREVAAMCKRNAKICQCLRYDIRESILKLQQYMQSTRKPYPANSLQAPHFAPSSPEYFSLSEFGFKRSDVIWVDKRTSLKDMEHLKEEVKGWRRIGLDTESIVARTALDGDGDVLALVQIAVQGKIYLIDTLHCDRKQLTQLFTNLLLNPTLTIIGHTLSDDLSTIRTLFTLPQPVCSITDIKLQYERIRNTHKELSLKNISKQILGKEICKKYCLTDWGRRPLNQCQMHYAGLDAVVVVRIWEKLGQEKGEEKDKVKEVGEVEGKGKEEVEGQREKKEEREREEIKAQS